MNRLIALTGAAVVALLPCRADAAELPPGVALTSKNSRLVIPGRSARRMVQLVVASDRPLEMRVRGPRVLDLELRVVQPGARKRAFVAELTVVDAVSGRQVTQGFGGGEGRSVKTKSARLQYVSPAVRKQLALEAGEHELRITLASSVATKFVVGIGVTDTAGDDALRLPPPEPEPQESPPPVPEPPVAAVQPEPEAQPEPKADEVAAADAPVIRLVVANTQITAADLDPVIGESISTVLSAEIALRGGARYAVMSRNDLKNLLVQQAEQLMLGGCADAACAKDLGELAEADQAVTSSIAHIGEEWVFTLELVDVKRGVVLSRQAVSWKGPPGGLVDLCRPYVARLLEGSGAEGYLGAVQVLSNETEALVHVNEREVGLTPVEAVGELPIGKHSVRILKDGYLPYETDLVVNRNETTIIQAQLVDEASLTPWYTRWWLWTGAAVIIGGGVAAAIMLTQDEASTTINIDTPLP